MTALNMPEKLSDEKMKSLFGAKYQSLLYYNFDTKKWNTDEFLGKGILGVDNNVMCANKIKFDIELMPEFKDYEMVGLVFMPIASEIYKQHFADFIRAPLFCMRKYSFNGYALVATLVVRNLKMGKIVPVSDIWAKANKAYTRYGLVQLSVQKFVKKLSEKDRFRRSFFAVNTPLK